MTIEGFMANQPHIDVTGVTRYTAADGDGTSENPYIPKVSITNAISGGGSGGSADFGTKINDATIPTGGVGNLGWLSAIWKLISDRIPTLVGGKIPVDVASINVSNFPATQPVSLASAPLPTDAATATNQATTNTTLNTIDGKLPTLVGGRVPVDLSAASIQVTGAYLEDLVSSVESLSVLLRNTVGYLLPDSGGRVRALLDTNSNISSVTSVTSVSSVSGVSSVTTLSNQTSVGGYFANEQIPSLMNMTAATVRANIISN